MPSDKTCCCSCFIFAGILVVLLAAFILLGRSFQTADYDEYALLRQISTGEIDRTVIYQGERVVKGPDFNMVSYKSTAHSVRLDKLAVATFDRVGIDLSVAFQYFLRKEDLVALHDEYRKGYEDIIKERVIDALKAKAPSFTIRQYIDERKLIENELFTVVRQRLEGKCCHETCQKKANCLPDCLRSIPCPLSDRGVFVEVRYFQLLWVSIAYEIEERYLQALLLQERAEASELKQRAAIIRKETEVLVQDIRNEANVVSRNAVAQRFTIMNQAQSGYSAILDSAMKTGQRLLYDRINITSEEQRNSFDYLRTLRRDPQCHLTVDFQQRTIGSWTKK